MGVLQRCPSAWRGFSAGFQAPSTRRLPRGCGPAGPGKARTRSPPTTCSWCARGVLCSCVPGNPWPVSLREAFLGHLPPQLLLPEHARTLRALLATMVSGHSFYLSFMDGETEAWVVEPDSILTPGPSRPASHWQPGTHRHLLGFCLQPCLGCPQWSPLFCGSWPVVRAGEQMWRLCPGRHGGEKSSLCPG